MAELCHIDNWVLVLDLPPILGGGNRNKRKNVTRLELEQDCRMKSVNITLWWLSQLPFTSIKVRRSARALRCDKRSSLSCV